MAALSKSHDGEDRRTRRSGLTPAQVALLNREGEAIEEAVAWHTVGIVADKGQSIGTGSAILWRNHPLILTARHVIETSPDNDLWFHFRDPGTMKRAPIEELPNYRDVRYKHKTRISIVRRCSSANVDLAALEVHQSVENEHSVQFFALPEESVTPAPGTIITMRGYPSDLKRIVVPGIAASFAMIQWSRIQDRPHFERFDPALEFLTKFVAADKGKRAYGYSGAGAWFNRPTDAVWHPSPALAGVCTAYFPRRKLLSILRIEHVTRFLNEVFPK